MLTTLDSLSSFLNNKISEKQLDLFMNELKLLRRSDNKT